MAVKSNTRATEEAADRIHSASIHLLRRVHREDAASGLSPARLSAMSVLVFAGPCTLGELAAAEHVTPPTMSRIVTALEADGLAERRTDPSDGRLVRVHATARGTQLLQRARRRRIAHLARLFAGLDRRQVAVVREAAELIERSLRAET